ncbi:acyl carrier protein, mitochondrial [Eurytemora carolleeae]|uniref:acyl carrier protein, mitochondrial n=1 Tax=Eurytemora carolleeae TaxID=1294199 RepID=UPI000C778B6C|nr:acyl carrier protein, mitochondrial [Eurytemora carolleeae]|eukprot:XP_023347125.1 acyl carrier protein, mitochondrial-like [Eurytemora affinis]
MFSVRSRIFSRLATLGGKALVESAPKVAAVRLLHFVNSSQGLLMKPQLEHPAWRDFRIVRFSSTLTQSEIESRVLAVCKAFDKISADKVTLAAHFINDLGLDSLDHVEVIMAIEDEFGFEIPDEHAEKLITPEHIVKYVLDHEDA